jgi:Lrp/AsnC family transcriptional regulator, leucine-responsive regulatory protein
MCIFIAIYDNIMQIIRMDSVDRQILILLQANAALSHSEIADQVHLSASQVSRRIARLETEGFICQQVALLSEAKLGLNVEAYVSVSLSSYAHDVVAGFQNRVSALEHVLDCSATTGEADYLLRIIVPDLNAFSALLNHDLLGHGDIASVRSNVVLQRIKRTSALPVP